MRARDYVLIRGVMLLLLMGVGGTALCGLFVLPMIIPGEWLAASSVAIVLVVMTWLWRRSRNARYRSEGSRTKQLLARLFLLVPLLALGCWYAVGSPELSTSLGLLAGLFLAVPSIMRPLDLSRAEARSGLFQGMASLAVVFAALAAKDSEIAKNLSQDDLQVFPGLAVAAGISAYSEFCWLLTTWRSPDRWFRHVPEQCASLHSYDRNVGTSVLKAQHFRISDEGVLCLITLESAEGTVRDDRVQFWLQSTDPGTGTPVKVRGFHHMSLPLGDGIWEWIVWFPAPEHWSRSFGVLLWDFGFGPRSLELS